MSRCSSPRFFNGSAAPVDCARAVVNDANAAAPMPAINDRRVCFMKLLPSMFTQLYLAERSATIADLLSLHTGFMQDRQQEIRMGCQFCELDVPAAFDCA